MLKKVIFAAGLLAATFASSPAAHASGHRASHSHRGLVAGHGLHLGRTRMAVRFHAGTRRFARARLGRRYGRIGLPRYAMTRRGHGRHYVYARRDTLIRKYVGPRQAYAPASTPVAIGGQVGGASYYSGGRTASGGIVGAATCAHRSLPFGTRVLVTNLNNARQAVLTVNDRGPFVGGRIVDVSRAAAGTLGMLGSGVARVSLKVIGGPG